MNRALLEVENLHVRLRTPHRIVDAVRGVSFSLGREKLGIVGERREVLAVSERDPAWLDG